MADGNPDNRQQDSTARESPDAAADGDGKCGDVDDTITASSSNSAVADGLSSLISSVMATFDSRAEASARSQDQLAFALDRLTGELDKLLEDAPSPFIMQHAARISGVRKRVRALNTVLKSVQRRIDNMDRMLSAGSPHKQWREKAASDNMLNNKVRMREQHTSGRIYVNFRGESHQYDSDSLGISYCERVFGIACSCMYIFRNRKALEAKTAMTRMHNMQVFILVVYSLSLSFMSSCRERILVFNFTALFLMIWCSFVMHPYYHSIYIIIE